MKSEERDFGFVGILEENSDDLPLFSSTSVNNCFSMHQTSK